MRRRNRSVGRLIAATLLTMYAATSGQASLECGVYLDAGYFDATYYLDGYWSETACTEGGYSLGEGQLTQDLRLKVE